MPLDGNGVASKPAGTTAIAGTTIESTKYNAMVDDVYDIINSLRPAFGGGDVNTPELARQALDLVPGTNVQDYSAALTVLAAVFTAASNAAGASLDFAEDTDNGTNRVRLKAPAALDANVDVTLPSTAGTLMLTDPDLDALAATGPAAFSGLLYALTLSNNASDATNDIDIAAGIAIDSTNAKFMTLASGLTKRLDATWAVGTNAGGLDTGTIADTTYHVWLIMRSDTGVVDVLFSASATAPTMPTNYDYKRRLGSIVRASSAIKAFVQNGDRFLWGAPVSDVVAASPGESAVTAALTVPAGVVVTALLTVGVQDGGVSGTNQLLITALSQADTPPSQTQSTLFWVAGGSEADYYSTTVEAVTNTNRQIRYRVADDANVTVYVTTHGWIDSRGKTA